LYADQRLAIASLAFPASRTGQRPPVASLESLRLSSKALSAKPPLAVRRQSPIRPPLAAKEIWLPMSVAAKFVEQGETL
jgi:hypothetical protein